ncbi:L-lactate permease [Streptoalloteichus hindustanus]|uniref:L-lactate permease n=1 Tax=Streptoalloteichus hindustanus TaxID=2017 RepID=A0A1M4Z9Y4_STRHI|nr:L-lactate permease [Streptoalloteichus hindustanus]SHF14824.1 lactate permease [Streptoalloteichus hindustanus]
MSAALAATPPMFALLLLLLRRTALTAALGAVAVAVVIALLAFPTPLDALVNTGARLAPTAVEVAVILLGGVVLNELLAASGTQRRLADAIAEACGGRGRAVVVVVLGVTPFAESVTGFGIGVVVAIPLLRRLGLSARQAAITGLLGLVTVPWGSMAPGTLVGAQLGGVGFQELGVRSAVLSLPVFLLAGAGALLVATGWRGLLGALPDLLVGTAVLWTVIWATNTWIGVPLAGVLGGLALITVALLLGRRTGGGVLRTLRPYLVLLAGLMGSRLVVALVDAEGWWTAVLVSPALWLVVTVAVTPRLEGVDPGTARVCVAAGVRRAVPVAASAVVFLALGALLTVTGMSAALAAAAAGLGPAYLGVAPFVAALGGFLAGSNTGANAMFAASQAAAAQTLGVPALALVGVQNVSAALAIMSSLPRVALAAQLASDQESGDQKSGDSAAPADTTTPTRVLPVVLAVDVVVLLALAAITVITTMSAVSG